ncbi:MAG: N-acetylglucosamine-6-phosphate deacetylase [Chloroflexota bacterium]|nr:N-acetylglucosamine-6-phosphate deacetylase [Chloroflexota bacterium]
MTAHEVTGRLVLRDEILSGRVRIEGGRIAGVVADPDAARGPYVAPGFIDLHVHGWGGFGAMDGADALSGMARALLRRGVTSFLPTAVSAPLDELRAFADTVRRWSAIAPSDGAAPAGFNLEGPFLSPRRRGAHATEYLRRPSDVAPDDVEDLVAGLRLITIAPELDGAVDLIARLAARGVVVSLGHSDATADQAAAGYAAGARSTTHLFNAMSGVEHRRPGLAVAALADDAVRVELIADNHHVHPALWPIIVRVKPPSGVLLVSDAISLAGSGDGRTRVGGLDVEVRGDRSTVVGSDTLAGSVIALDTAVRNMTAAGIALTDAVAAASTNPATLVGLDDRGTIEPGRRADLVELDDELRVVGVLREGRRV